MRKKIYTLITSPEYFNIRLKGKPDEMLFVLLAFYNDDEDAKRFKKDRDKVRR